MEEEVSPEQNPEPRQYLEGSLAQSLKEQLVRWDDPRRVWLLRTAVGVSTWAHSAGSAGHPWHFLQDVAPAKELVLSGLLGSVLYIPYQDDFSKIQVLYHTPPPEQFFSFLLALWIKITSSWQGQQVPGLGRTLQLHLLPISS